MDADAGSLDRPIWISGCCVDYDYDALSEILMRLDPENLFKCIIVSKDWLSVITRPDFRTKYLRKWKDSSSRVVGFLLHDHWDMIQKKFPRLQLLPTSNLGRDIIRNAMDSNWMLAGGTEFFISKSPKGSLLLFGGARLEKFYVCKPSSSPVELPPPPKHYRERCMANILGADDGDGDGDGEDYKVILAVGHCNSRTNDNEVCIQTYCSQTGKWEQSTLTCSTSLLLDPCAHAVEGGIVDTAGVIYWKARMKFRHKCLAGWDVNGGCISVIPAPPFREDRRTDGHFFYYTTYGVSPQPQGSLLAATCGYPNYKHQDFDWDSEWLSISIYALDDDRKDWYLLHSVRHESIWTNNALLMPLFEYRSLLSIFKFLSFVPGKSDSVFLGLEDQLFVYHFPTGKLVEHEEYLKYGFEFLRHRGIARKHGKCGEDASSYEIFNDFVAYHPLTVLDLGIWPSSPPALQLPHGS